MWMIWIICGLIVVAVIGLSLLTTHKGYQYEHTIDPLPDQKEQQEKKAEEPEDRNR